VVCHFPNCDELRRMRRIPAAGIMGGGFVEAFDVFDFEVFGVATVAFAVFVDFRWLCTGAALSEGNCTK
jgi:hypothetical protein